MQRLSLLQQYVQSENVKTLYDSAMQNSIIILGGRPEALQTAITRFLDFPNDTTIPSYPLTQLLIDCWQDAIDNDELGYWI